MRKYYRKNLKLEPWQDPDVTPYLIIENLSKDYEGVPVLKNVNLEIYQEEFFCLLGPSGCGKTTLLRTLAGFETPSKGKIYLNGVDITRVPPYERPVSMMFQSYALFPHLSVQQNVAFGLKQENLTSNTIQERVDHSLRLVEMADLAKRKPHQLSGGQRQRVALARSLAKQPQLLLLDEPLAALDRKLREKTQFELVNIQETVGGTFLTVTHDQEEAMTMASRLAVMEEGQIVQLGTPQEIYEFPNSRYVANFIGTMNLFEGMVVDEDDDHLILDVQDFNLPAYVSPAVSVPEGSLISMALRPEKVHISKRYTKRDFNHVMGTVEDIAYLVDVSIYHVRLENSDKTMQAMIPNNIRASEGKITWEDQVYLSWDPSNVVVLMS
ncbi:MAG: polyamine ABC transporter ATP-binding protein [Alphaproteobacteria bacterium]|nr:MAG: polyamine ABC transporter ATP-binding protein [Alphaproteobacteria bacterium]